MATLKVDTNAIMDTVEITLNPELIPYACSEYRSDTASNLHCSGFLTQMLTSVEC
jgi:hypothetical protein